jgi:hypothetical protein
MRSNPFHDGWLFIIGSTPGQSASVIRESSRFWNSPKRFSD